MPRGRPRKVTTANDAEETESPARTSESTATKKNKKKQPSRSKSIDVEGEDGSEHDKSENQQRKRLKRRAENFLASTSSADPYKRNFTATRVRWNTSPELVGEGEAEESGELSVDDEFVKGVLDRERKRQSTISGERREEEEEREAEPEIDADGEDHEDPVEEEQPSAGNSNDATAALKIRQTTGGNYSTEVLEKLQEELERLDSRRKILQKKIRRETSRIADETSGEPTASTSKAASASPERRQRSKKTTASPAHTISDSDTDAHASPSNSRIKPRDSSQTSPARAENHTPPNETKSRPPRVPWTDREVACLIDAVEEHGSAWSQILSLHGRHGNVSQDLSNRTQVQLKDKARNIKLSRLRKNEPLGRFESAAVGSLQDEIIIV